MALGSLPADCLLGWVCNTAGVGLGLAGIRRGCWDVSLLLLGGDLALLVVGCGIACLAVSGVCI